MRNLIPHHLTWAEIDLKALSHNFLELRRLSKKNKFLLPTHGRRAAHVHMLCVIKADAYGHGMKHIAKILERLDVDFFAVSDVEEGKTLRQVGIRKPILLLESPLPEFISDIIQYDLMPTVCSWDLAKGLDRAAKKKKRVFPIHVKVDTGMGRLGIWHEIAFDFIKKIYSLRNLKIDGIYTHFPAADTDRAFTLKQIGHLYDLVVRLDKEGFIIPWIHASNSIGLAEYKTKVLNLVRPGLMIYGLYPNKSYKSKIRLKPVLSVKSRIIFIKEITAGRTISYGRTFTAKRSMRVATIPIGYSDGYLRTLSNKASVIIDGKRCHILGRVTMDQIVVDISHVKNAKVGSVVTILGRDGKENLSADELAQLAQTINYEIVCNLGNRLPRLYK